MRHGMKVQVLTPYHVSHLQCYSVMVCSNVTSVYPPILLAYVSVMVSFCTRGSDA